MNYSTTEPWPSYNTRYNQLMKTLPVSFAALKEIAEGYVLGFSLATSEGQMAIEPSILPLLMECLVQVPYLHIGLRFKVYGPWL